MVKDKRLIIRLNSSDLKLLDDICSMIGRNRSETIRDLIIAFHVLAKSGIWQRMPTVPELAEKVLKEK
jgi:metal-responsive CopG/Arc/MetJ family transcriptional regulator